MEKLVNFICIVGAISFYTVILAVGSIASGGLFLLLIGAGFFLWWMWKMIREEWEHDKRTIWKDDYPPKKSNEPWRSDYYDDKNDENK